MSFYLSIIIPAFNEEHRLRNTLAQTIDFLDAQPFTSEIIVVTDNSTDKTIEVAESFIPYFPNLKVLNFPMRKGKGFCVKAGMLAGQAKYRMFMDADHAVPVGMTLTLLSTLQEGFDIVIGSRAMQESVILANQGFMRRQLTKVFGLMQQTILRLPFKDTQCGFKIFTAQAVEEYFPQVTFNCSYFDAELLYIAHNAGARVTQIPVIWRHDKETRIPIGFWRSIDLAGKLCLIPGIHANKISAARQVEKSGALS